MRFKLKYSDFWLITLKTNKFPQIWNSGVQGEFVISRKKFGKGVGPGDVMMYDGVLFLVGISDSLGSASCTVKSSVEWPENKYWLLNGTKFHSVITKTDSTWLNLYSADFNFVQSFLKQINAGNSLQRNYRFLFQNKIQFENSLGFTDPSALRSEWSWDSLYLHTY